MVKEKDVIYSRLSIYNGVIKFDILGGGEPLKSALLNRGGGNLGYG